MRRVVWAVLAAMSISSAAHAAAVVLPSPFTVSATSGGASFTYNGTLTGSDTIAFTTTMAPCLQPNSTYCTNGAGVVVVAGTSGVGTANTNGSNSTTAGSLLLTISGVGFEQIYATNAANGLGSSSPPTSLTLSTSTLSSLGFGSFSVTNPTLTFTVSDCNNCYGDNSGQFVLTQSATAVDEPMNFAVLLTGLVGLTLYRRYKSQ